MKVTAGIAEQRTERSSTLVGLDCVRGLSAIVVCLTHAFYGFVSPAIGPHWAHYLMDNASYFALLIFFVLSGFMITLSILRNVQTYGGVFSHRAYLAARVARIYPPLLFALAVQAVVFAVIAGLHLHGSTAFRLPGDLGAMRNQIGLSWPQMVYPLFHVQQVFVNIPLTMNGPLWSLPYEFWIYVVVGCWSVWVINRNGVGGLVTFALLLVAISSRSKFFLPYFAIWLIGAFWALARHERWHAAPRFSAWVYGMACVNFGAMITTLLWVGRRRVLFGEGIERLLFGGLVCALAAAVGFLVRRHWQQLLAATPRLTTACSATARFSYTLYLVHFPLVLLAMSVLRPRLYRTGLAVQIALWLAVVAVCLGIAWAVARVVEDRRRTLPWLKRVLRVPAASPVAER